MDIFVEKILIKKLQESKLSLLEYSIICNHIERLHKQKELLEKGELRVVKDDDKKENMGRI